MRRRTGVRILLWGLGVIALAPPAAASPCRVHSDGFGVMVMAHGGSAVWNAAVEAAVRPLQACYPVEIAFGMADPATMQGAVSRLEDRGVSRITVVRLFVSGESWLERTEQILGLRSGAPSRPEGAAGGDTPAGHDTSHAMALWRIESRATFRVSREGLAEDPSMGAVLADRARALSRNPAREQVLVLAHGPGDDAENDRWISWLEARADSIRAALPFHAVGVMTLREDWPDKRAEAARRIRASVETARSEGVTTIVIPFRVQGFGPYAGVLDGLEYVADGVGLLPHSAVTDWIAEQAERRTGPPTASPATPGRSAAARGRR